MSAEATTWASSLPNVVSNLVHAAAPSLPGLQTRRTFTLPTSRFSMGELVTAIGRVRGADVHPLVTYRPEPRIEALFGSFGELRTDAAQAAGFERDTSLVALVRLALQGDASGV